MLSSLFGEFGPRRLPVEPADQATVATTVVDTDVIVESDPARAMREHFDTTRFDLGQASAMITLLDPSGIWAPQVIRALCAAAGLRVERLNLRDRATLRSLAVIERTSVPRSAADALKVYHAESRLGEVAGEELGNALAERSQLTAVIVGALAPHAVTGLLRNLLAATRQPDWRCPWLVFIVPPGAAAMRRRILEQDWPRQVRTAAMSESLTGPASVWNAVLTAWEAAARTVGAPPIAPAPGAPASEPAPQWMARALESIATIDGVLGCAMVDTGCADLLAIAADADLQPEMRRLAGALCAARRAHLVVGGPELPAPDEITVSSGARQAMLRPLTASQTLGCLVLLDGAHCDLAKLRDRLIATERQAD